MRKIQTVFTVYREFTDKEVAEKLLNKLNKNSDVAWSMKVARKKKDVVVNMGCD